MRADSRGAESPVTQRPSKRTTKIHSKIETGKVRIGKKQTIKNFLPAGRQRAGTAIKSPFQSKVSVAGRQQCAQTEIYAFSKIAWQGRFLCLEWI
jgi:ribosomal protein L30E